MSEQEQSGRWKAPEGCPHGSPHDIILDVGCLIEIIADDVKKEGVGGLIWPGLGESLHKEAGRLHAAIAALVKERDEARVKVERLEGCVTRLIAVRIIRSEMWVGFWAYADNPEDCHGFPKPVFCKTLEEAFSAVCTGSDLEPTKCSE